MLKIMIIIATSSIGIKPALTNQQKCQYHWPGFENNDYFAK